MPPVALRVAGEPPCDVSVTNCAGASAFCCISGCVDGCAPCCVRPVTPGAELLTRRDALRLPQISRELII